MTSTDLTFFTNEEGKSLLNRFEKVLKSTKFFDCLVGYFYTSGFYKVYKSLEDTEKIRILVGISTNRQTFKLMQESQSELDQFSHTEIKDKFKENTKAEFEVSPDSKETEDGATKFKKWIKSKKLEIKAYPSSKIHAKLYVLTLAENPLDEVGRVITGSSNFTSSGFKDNLEFNVELKNKSDYDFALNKFNELWEHAVDVSEDYVETINRDTWLNDSLKPYELYLKFLYEYFKEKIKQDHDDNNRIYLPDEFLDLEYQKEAVTDAESKLDKYGGVFISDVVGLGKTFISAMLAQKLDGRTLVIAPPALLDENNPGSWNNVFSDFRIAADFKSLGKLDHLIKRGTGKYDNIFIDEAHRFRTENNVTYEKLARICRGKRIILVSATPLNNSPKDILSQIKLFQNSKKSTIPNVRDLDNFFKKLDGNLKGLDRKIDRDDYIKGVKNNSIEIRDKVLKHIMVRRTRKEVEKYFGEDLKRQKLKFPDVAEPTAAYYELNDYEDEVFTKTIELIAKKFKYSRYKPLSYYKKELTQPEKLAQENMGKFMKILLIKRLESSFYAFNKSIERFIGYYEKFIEQYNKGHVYISKKYINKVFEYLDNDSSQLIEKMIEDERVEKLDAKDFKKEFKIDLQKDLEILKEIKEMWGKINRDPKLLKFKELLSNDKVLKGKKIVLFTESKETAEYIGKNILMDKVIVFSGESSSATREKVIENFDAKARNKKDDYNVLITTEVLAEGVNLHRSNVVLNYDIPWNPTRLMQRVGRVNRVDTSFDKIYTYNFFPTAQANDQIKLKEAAESKIEAFIEMLGADAKLLTDGEEIKSHDLFSKLMSKKSISDEDEEEDSELKYLDVIRKIRNTDKRMFERLKRLPKKARTSRLSDLRKNSTFTYFRKGELQKFFVTNGKEISELDFISAAKLLEVPENEKRTSIGKEFYEHLDLNRKEFEFATTEELIEHKMKGGRDSTTIILRILKSNQVRSFREFTEEDKYYIKDVVKLLEEGALPKQTQKVLVKVLQKEKDPLKILAKLQKNIPDEFFVSHVASSSAKTQGPREVILSEYFGS